MSCTVLFARRCSCFDSMRDYFTESNVHHFRNAGSGRIDHDLKNVILPYESLDPAKKQGCWMCLFAGAVWISKLPVLIFYHS